jgi:cytochrome P450
MWSQTAPWADCTLPPLAVTTAPIAESPAGPTDDELPLPPLVPGSRVRTSVALTVRMNGLMMRARNEYGDVFRVRTLVRKEPVTVVNHPDHVKSLLTQKDLAPSVTGESPLRPVVGANSTLTALGERHMRQRKLLLPSFHGEAVERYAEMIADAAEREVDSWSPGQTVELTTRMQAITLDVIMAGIFGVEGRPEEGTAEDDLRNTVRMLADVSTSPGGQLAQFMNLGRDEPFGLLKIAITQLRRPVDRVIRERRADPDAAARNDILSLLLRAETEEGELLTDVEVRDELVGLVLAGHETTANQLGWAFERLVRTPEAWARLREEVRDGNGSGYVDATIYESQRSRPVIPMIGRKVIVPWRFGDHGIPAEHVALMSILLLHHREDLYPEPFAFRPERFVDTKPGTYTWIPFGGGIRRCLGATLAMAEMRIVVSTIARRCELRPARPEAEVARHRNVTMIPAGNAAVVVTARD